MLHCDRLRMTDTSADRTEIRLGEACLDLPATTDAQIYFLGRIRTPWSERRECPRSGDLDGPLCTIEIFEPFRPALLGTERHTHLQILYWMDRARRDLATQSPHGGTRVAGTFSLRSPIRPNPIASSVVTLVEVHPDRLVVRGLDCVDGTPLVDIKPDACPNASGKPA
jgi:tRNA-Thr(GGU) m(6)t(6)A37 methyltransferase TsaA